MLYIQENDFEAMAQKLGRKLTDKEKEELQMKSDLAHAFDLLGKTFVCLNMLRLGTEDESVPSFANISSKLEFEQYGATVGKFFTSRSKNDFYNDFLNRLFVNAVEPREFPLNA